MSATLSHQLSHEVVQDFTVPPEVLFENIFFQPAVTKTARSDFGAYLSIYDIGGEPRNVGGQVLIRVNWGIIDLEIEETILEKVPPYTLRARQQAVRFLPYNPAERLPPIGDEVPENLDRMFARAYGTPPLTAEILYDLSEWNDGTRLNLKVEMKATKKPGWLGRRLWRKRMTQEAEVIFNRLGQSSAQT